MLPVYGGSPSVWTICLLFFQLLLWIAYGYSWTISRIKSPYLWRLTHLIVFTISFSAIPLMLAQIVAGDYPEFSILITLIKQLSLPLLVIASSAPLIQLAYSQTSLNGAKDPYFLYAASNSGSLLALLLYPFVIERFIGLHTQFWCWSVGYVAYFVCLSFCFFTIPFRSSTLVANQQADNLSWRLIANWLVLSFIPCSLMLGVTFYVTSDVAATPLLWVIPLALYLLSFVFTFQSKPWISTFFHRRYLLLVIFFPLLIILSGPNFLKAWQLILFHFAAFFALAIYCHGRIYASRPPAYHLTLFYVTAHPSLKSVSPFKA